MFKIRQCLSEFALCRNIDSVSGFYQRCHLTECSLNQIEKVFPCFIYFTTAILGAPFFIIFNLWLTSKGLLGAIWLLLRMVGLVHYFFRFLRFLFYQIHLFSRRHPDFLCVWLEALVHSLLAIIPIHYPVTCYKTVSGKYCIF